MGERAAYSTDLSDERWALIEPVLPAWKARHPSASGHVGGYAYREIVNAVVYQNRTGCCRTICRRGVQGGVAHGVTMRRDRLVPDLRHAFMIRRDHFAYGMS